MKIKRLNKSDFKRLKGLKNLPTKNENFIIIGIFSKTFTPQAISKRLKLEPTKTGLMGHSFTGKYNKSPQLYNEHQWVFEKRWQSKEFISDDTETFIAEILKPRLSAFRKLQKDSELIFTLVQYYYLGPNPGYYFSPEALLVLSQAGFSIDIDAYCLAD